MNRNLHSPTKLTEFARDFDVEPDTLLSKFVSKITNAYNSGYNTVNVIPTSSSVLNVQTISNSSTYSTNIDSSCSPSTSVHAKQQSAKKNEIEDNLQDINDSNDIETSNSVIDRIGGLMNRNQVRYLLAFILL